MSGKFPCSLCHLCVKVERETHGFHCMWYDTYISKDDAEDSDFDLRRRCASSTDGDGFRWRLTKVTPAEMVMLRIDLVRLPSVNIKANLTLWISVLSLIVSVAALLLSSR